ncbi:MAG: hypothetical protein ACLQBQ_05860 [Smithella sp.]
MEDLFEKIRKDLKKGIVEGISALKEGATVVSEKINEIKAEGKRQYKIFDLKSKIQSQMTELGGRVYAITDSNKSLNADGKIKAFCLKIKKLEWQLHKLEGDKKIKAASSRKPKAKVTRKKFSKTATKKTAAKKVNL